MAAAWDPDRGLPTLQTLARLCPEELLPFIIQG